ncbi:hypothetical protein BJV77DRAFT_1073382 [Russula vinacea]|nr:hypothetical protein BJV77DRAFT_1073382 [Russula vinacea]
MYFKIAEEEDNEVVERCQRDADGTLIFSGLFSATVGALLTISFPDLKPNSQDTSAFYLQNLYQLQFPATQMFLIVDPVCFGQTTCIFSSKICYLGELTLVLELDFQYISISQHPWGTLAKRARMRALFSKGSPGPYNTFWGTGHEPNYLHFSVLLFVVGSLIYLFNINRAVFYAVACLHHNSRTERDDRWTMLVKEEFAVPDHVLQDSLAHGDSVLLSILTHFPRRLSRQFLDFGDSVVTFQVRHKQYSPSTATRLCSLWNEIVQEASNQESSSTPIRILRDIRHLYIALHQDTDAAPNAFSASTTIPQLTVLFLPLNWVIYPIPHLTSPHLAVASLAPFTADLSTASEIGERSQAPTAIFPVHPSSPSSDKSPQDGAATAQPDTISAANPLESTGNSQQGPVTPHVAPLADIGAVLSTAPASAPVEASTTPVFDKPSGAYEASPDFISKPSLPIPFSGFSAPDSPPPLHVPPFPNSETLSLLSDMSPKGPSDNAYMPVNNETMYIANAALQSVVCCPPFRELFRDLGQMPVDKSPPTYQATRGEMKEDEGGKENKGAHSFLSTDVYDAMKEKRQFAIMRDGPRQDAAGFLGLYLEALDEELFTLQSSIIKHKPTSTPKVDELEGEIRSGEGQTEVGERDYTASSFRSPILRIFDGRSHSTVRAPGQPDTVTVEDWRSLKLNIQPDSVHTIQDALAHVSQPQPVQVDKSSSGEASQQVLLETLPPVLVLHLERFLYDAGADGINKTRKPVQFTPDLEIPLEIMVPVAGKSVEPAHYKLYGVLYHCGESASGGHYTVDVLHPDGDDCGGEGWLHIDDDGVSKVRHEDVFGRHSDEHVDDQCAYMLFYCRTAPARI